MQAYYPLLRCPATRDDSPDTACAPFYLSAEARRLFFKSLNHVHRVDALGEARVKGPDGEEKTAHLYPEGSESGRYAGSFRAPAQGEYKVTYSISMPDDELLENKQNPFLKLVLP